MTINKAKLKKIIKEEMQKYLGEDGNYDEPPVLVSFAVHIYEDEHEGKLWVNFVNETSGESGNDPLDSFARTLRYGAEQAQSENQREADAGPDDDDEPEEWANDSDHIKQLMKMGR